MTDKVLLTKVIKKAVKGGFDFFGHSSSRPAVIEPSIGMEQLVLYEKREPKFGWFTYDDGIGCNWEGDLYGVPFERCKKCGYGEESTYRRPAIGDLQNWTMLEIIYSHEFAKAFWGEEPVSLPIPEFVEDMPAHIDDMLGDEDWTMPRWKYELQQMVLTDDPLRFLERFL